MWFFFFFLLYSFRFIDCTWYYFYVRPFDADRDVTEYKQRLDEFTGHAARIDFFPRRYYDVTLLRNSNTTLKNNNEYYYNNINEYVKTGARAQHACYMCYMWTPTSGKALLLLTLYRKSGDVVVRSKGMPLRRTWLRNCNSSYKNNEDV